MVRRASDYIYELTFHLFESETCFEYICISQNETWLSIVKEGKMYRYILIKIFFLRDKCLMQFPDCVICTFFDYCCSLSLMILLHHPLRDCSVNYNALWLSTTREALSYRSICCNISSMTGYLPLSLQPLIALLPLVPHLTSERPNAGGVQHVSRVYVRLCSVNT